LPAKGFRRATVWPQVLVLWARQFSLAAQATAPQAILFRVAGADGSTGARRNWSCATTSSIPAKPRRGVEKEKVNFVVGTLSAAVQLALLLGVIQAAPRRFRLLGSGGVEARKITIGFGVFPPPQPLTIFNDRRTTTRLPDGACLHVSVLLLGRLRRSRANDAGAIDAEARRLAGGKGSSGGYGGRLGCCRGSGGLRRICRVGGASMVHRPGILLRGRTLLRRGCRIASGNNEQGTHDSAHFQNLEQMKWNISH
jgi:hypothetical protein